MGNLNLGNNNQENTHDFDNSGNVKYKEAVPITTPYISQTQWSNPEAYSFLDNKYDSRYAPFNLSSKVDSNYADYQGLNTKVNSNYADYQGLNTKVDSNYADYQGLNTKVNDLQTTYNNNFKVITNTLGLFTNNNGSILPSFSVKKIDLIKPITATYSPINIDEIEVYNSTGVLINIASVGGTSASSSCLNDDCVNYGHSKLINGIKNEGIFPSHTYSSMKEERMTINFNSPVDASKIVIYNRASCCGNRINGCYVEVTTGSGGKIRYPTITGPDGATSPSEGNNNSYDTYTINLASGVLTPQGIRR